MARGSPACGGVPGAGPRYAKVMKLPRVCVGSRPGSIPGPLRLISRVARWSRAKGSTVLQFGSDRTIRSGRGWRPLRAKAPRRRVRFPPAPAIW